MINESNLQKTSQKLLLFRLDLELCHVWMWSIYDSTDFAFTHCLHLFRHKTSVQHFDLSFSIIWVYFWQPCRVLSMRIQQLLSYLAMSYWLKKRNEMSLFFFFKFIEEHGWFALLCWFVLYSKAIQLYAYIFFTQFETMWSMVYHRILTVAPCDIQ